MSGFFHRLTQSALGKAPVLQPTTPTSAYLAQPLFEEASEDALMAPLAGRPRRTVASPDGPKPNLDVQERRSEAMPEPLVPKAPETRDEQRANEPEPIEDRRLPPEPPVSKHPVPEPRRAEPSTKLTDIDVEPRSTEAGGTESTAVTPDSATPVGRANDRRDVRLGDLPTLHDVQPSQEPDRTQPAELRFLPKLVTAVETARSEAQTLPAFAPTPAASETKESVENGGTEVHISIGRIEVTAEAAPPAAEKPKRRREATSLAHYLAERDGGRR